MTGKQTTGKIGLVTDGTCDLPAAIAAQHHVHVVPHHVIWGEETFTDGINLTAEAFYERLAHDPQLPKTAQPSAAEFADAYRAVQQQTDADTILCVATSPKITGAYGSAVLAASMVPFPVRVVDTGTATVALGLTVLAVADAIERGADMDQAEQVARQASANSRFFFTLNTLEFLYRGGRIGKAQHMIGNMLNIKPLLHIKDGMVDSLERVRSRKQAITHLVEYCADYANKRPLRMAVVHSNIHSNAAELQEFSQTLQQKFAPDQFFQTLACSPVGVYAGPGSIGVGLVAGF